MIVSLIYPETSVKTGYGSYALRLYVGLKALGVNIESIPVKKVEVSVLGRPFLGNLSQSASAKMKRPKGELIHSLTPNVVNKNTDIVTLHDLIPLTLKDKFSKSLYSSKGNKMVYENLKRVPFIIVFSELWKKYAVEYLNYDPEKLFVVPQSIDHSTFYSDRNEKLIRQSKSLVVTVGDFNPRKRYDILYEAIGDMEDMVLVHIGPTNSWKERKGELEKLANKYDNIEILGMLDDTSLREYMSSADLLVHLSEAEGFGLTPIEAMACGTNVLVNDIEIFKENLTNMAFYTRLDKYEVQRQIRYAINNKRTKTELINYTKRFSMEKMAKGTLEVYNQVLNIKKT